MDDDEDDDANDDAEGSSMQKRTRRMQKRTRKRTRRMQKRTRSRSLGSGARWKAGRDEVSRKQAAQSTAYHSVHLNMQMKLWL